MIFCCVAAIILVPAVLCQCYEVVNSNAVILDIVMLNKFMNWMLLRGITFILLIIQWKSLNLDEM